MSFSHFCRVHRQHRDTDYQLENITILHNTGPLKINFYPRSFNANRKTWLTPVLDVTLLNPALDLNMSSLVLLCCQSLLLFKIFDGQRV